MCVSRGASNPIKNLIIDSTSDAVVVRKGNHPFKAVPGIQSQRNTLYPAWGLPLSLHILERPIIIFRFSDHIGSVRTPCTLNLTKTMMNRHPHLPYCGDGCYPRYYYEFSANDVIIIQPIILFIRYLTFALAGRAFLPRKSAPVLTPHHRIILILREYLPGRFRHFSSHPPVYMECSMLPHPGTLAFRTDSHLWDTSTAGTIMTAVSCAYTATHTNGALRSDQQNRSANPAATHPIILTKSPSMMLIKSADTLTNPHSPANSVSRMLPAMPITFIKVFDTIDVIMSFLYLV